MRRALSCYWAVAVAGVHANLQYRAAAALSVFSAALACALQVFLWHAVYAEADRLPGIALNSLTTYVVVAQLLGLLHANKVDDVVSGEVYRGDIAVSLLRPVSYAATCMATHLPSAVVTAALAGIPVLIVFALLTTMRIPTPLDLILFAVATMLGMLLAFELNFLVGLAAFLTTNTWGIRMIKNAGVAFLAGQVVPLDLLPEQVASVVRLLPFQGLVDGPLRLLTGSYDGAADVLVILSTSAAWVLVLLALGRLAWRAALGRIEVLGG